MMAESIIIARVGTWVYLLAIVAVAIGDIASFARLLAVAVAFCIEAVARMPEPLP